MCTQLFQIWLKKLHVNNKTTHVATPHTTRGVHQDLPKIWHLDGSNTE